MTIPEMEHIICAVRGGRESRETVTQAIDLALEHNARLTFFHVMDAEFLGAATPMLSSIRTVYQQLHEMGEFALLILCDRAERRGVSEVDCLVREGNIRKQLYQFAFETHAKLMVMGRPVRSPGSNVFKPEEFDTFVDELEKETGLKIITVQPKV
jgi:nucleotide-binding universal stress UspA family protein